LFRARASVPRRARQADTRRKILLVATVLARVDRGEFELATVRAWLDGALPGPMIGRCLNHLHPGQPDSPRRRSPQLPVPRRVLNAMRLLTVALNSPLRDGSNSTLKSDELNTDGTRRPAGRIVPAGNRATASRNSRAIRRLSSAAGRAFQLLGRTMPRSASEATESSGI